MNKCDLQIEIENILGEERAKKYAKLVPLLVLIYYRAKGIDDAEGGLVAYDKKYYFTGIKGAFQCVAVRLLGTYFFIREKIKWIKNREKGTHRQDGVLFSETIELSPRYVDIRKTIGKQIDRRVVFTISNCFQSSKENGKRKIKPRDTQNIIPVLACKNTICGTRLKKSVMRWVHFLNGENRQFDIDKELYKLNKVYEKRVDYFEKVLQKNNITHVITCNQYNLPDLILMHAAHKLKVRTILYNHHPFLAWGRKENDIEKHQFWGFAKEVCVWNNLDLDYCSNHVVFYNLLDSGRVQVRAVGSIELDLDAQKKNLERYKKQKIITFFYTYYPDSLRKDTEHYHEILNYVLKIYRALHKLKERTGYNIRVRYKPGMNQDIIESEKSVLKMYGFECSKSTPDSLYQDIYESTAVVAQPTSAMIVACCLGCSVYRLPAAYFEHGETDERIKDISIEDLADLDIEEKNVVFDEDDFFSLEKLIS